MKRVFGIIAAVAGVGGLIALLGYHPKTDALGGISSVPQPSSDGSTLSQETPVTTPATTPVPSSSGKFRDGTYTGSTVNVGYGPVQVAAVISGGKLTNVQFLQMPFEANRSAMIASEAKPILLQEAVSAQSADVDLVTGATSDWEGFKESLQAALSKAQA